jgi:hypothetical protein
MYGKLILESHAQDKEEKHNTILLDTTLRKQLRIDRNLCSIHEEITSIRLYTPGNPRSRLRKGVYNLIEVISNEPNE